MGVITTSPPPPTLPAAGGGGRGWVELIRARDDIDAHLLTGRLETAGIETRTVPDRWAPGAWLYGGSNPWAPVVVLVRAVQLEDARLALAEVAYDLPAAPGPSRAPAPDRPEGRRVALVWWLTALTLGLLLTGSALVQAARSIEPCRLGVLCGEGER